jgi:hypothetical protein
MPHYCKPLVIIATVGSLFTLSGCIIAPDQNGHRGSSGSSYNQASQTQHSSDPEWNRGCTDAKNGYYDNDRHPQAYKDGHRACESGGGSSHGSNDGYQHNSGQVNVYDLKGRNVGYAEDQLYARGFNRAGGSGSTDSWWFNSRTNQCIQLIIIDDSVTTLMNKKPENCQR